MDSCKICEIQNSYTLENSDNNHNHEKDTFRIPITYIDKSINVIIAYSKYEYVVCKLLLNFSKSKIAKPYTNHPFILIPELRAVLETSVLPLDRLYGAIPTPQIIVSPNAQGRVVLKGHIVMETLDLDAPQSQWVILYTGTTTNSKIDGE